MKNMNLSFKLTLAALALTCSAVYAEARYVPLPIKVDSSDLIARVEVLSTTEIVPEARSLKAGEYRSYAQVKVLQSIKGLKAGDIYTLEFDNGMACPNVEYKKGDECLIFNTKMSNGHYETFNTYYGKYVTKENKVFGWQNKPNQTAAFDDVISEITKIMQTPKNPEQKTKTRDFNNPL